MQIAVLRKGRRSLKFIWAAAHAHVRLMGIEYTTGSPMAKETKAEVQPRVDKGLVAMFLRMSPEERLRANDNAIRAILELRHAYRRQRTSERRSWRNS